MDNYVGLDIEQVTQRMKNEIEEIEQKIGEKINFSEYATIAIENIRNKAIKGNGTIDLADQHLVGAILGSMLHKAYCDSRKLDKPNEQGLQNNPRIKKLTDEMDIAFCKQVKDGTIKQSPTLFIDEKGVVNMDIANTEFVNLSPFWKKDNYMAGKAAARTVLTSWEGLNHSSEEVRKYVMIAIANSIHESWIARGNVYFDKSGDQIYTNQDLDTAYIYLPNDEKIKDLEHVKMAVSLIGELTKGLDKKQDKQNEEQENQPC